MSSGYDEYDVGPPMRRRREAIIDRRLRKARGEDVEDAYDDDYDDDYDDEYYAPVSLERSSGVPRYPSAGGGGCAQATLYIVLGGLIVVLVFALLFRGTLGAIGDFFSRSAPAVADIVASPTPTLRLDAMAVVQRVQQLNRLETTSYTVEKVIEAGIEGNAFEDILFGDRLLLIANGTVVAGVDLAKIDPAGVAVSADGSTVTLRLPPVEIFSTTLDNEQTRVYDRQQGLLASADKDLETQARQAAESEILQAACEGGIMERAQQDSQRAMEQFLGLLDVQQVVVESAAVPPCTVAAPPPVAPAEPAAPAAPTAPAPIPASPPVTP